MTPRSLKMAMRGTKTPSLVLERFRQYALTIIKIIPQNPPALISSPRIIRPVRIMNSGVKAKKGTVKDKGDTLSAFM